MKEFIIKYWLEAIFTAILGLIGWGYRKLKKRQEEQQEEQEKKNEEQERKNKAIENGVQALLRNELIKNFREYKIQGEITLLDKENMEHMFEEYFNLEGNGMMTDVHKEFLEIPIKIIKE